MTNKESIDTASAWLGILVAAIAGSFTFIGVDKEEVSVVLRNSSWEPTLVASLIAVAILTSLLSIFSGSREVSVWTGLSLIAAAAAVLPLSSWAVPAPGSTSLTRAVALGAGVALLGLAVVVPMGPLLSTYVRAKGGAFSFQPVLLVASVLLSCGAVFTGMRLETQVQYDATSAQLSTHITRGDGGTQLSLDVQAFKLGRFDEVRITVKGAVAGQNLEDIQVPCDSLKIKCEFIGGAILEPDQQGVVKSTVEMPIDEAQFDHISIDARVCLSPLISEPGCAAERRTNADFRIRRTPDSSTPSEPAPDE